jgi:hypothetical protein
MLYNSKVLTLLRTASAGFRQISRSYRFHHTLSSAPGVSNPKLTLYHVDNQVIALAVRLVLAMTKRVN